MDVDLKKILKRYKIQVFLLSVLALIEVLAIMAAGFGFFVMGCAGCINIACKGQTIDASTCAGCSMDEVSSYVIIGIVGLVVTLIVGCLLLKIIKDADNCKKIIAESGDKPAIKDLKWSEMLAAIFFSILIIAAGVALGIFIKNH